MAETTKITRSIRADQQTFDRLAALARESFGEGGQGAALEALLNVWNIQNAKEGIADRKTEIEDFDSHLQAIQRAFIGALTLAQSAEERARNDFRAKLEQNAREINELHEKVELAKLEAKNADSMRAAAAREATTQIDKVENLEKSLKAAQATISDKEQIISALNEQITKLTTAAKEAEPKLALAERYQQQAEEWKARVETLESEAIVSAANLKTLEAEAKAHEAQAVAEAKDAMWHRLSAAEKEIRETSERAITAETQLTHLKEELSALKEAQASQPQQKQPKTSPSRKKSTTDA